MREIVMCEQCGIREAKRRTCGHPICVRKQRKLTAKVTNKRRYDELKARRQVPPGYYGPDHSARAAVIKAMRAALEAGADELDAVVRTAIKTNSRPATVIAIWRSAA